MNTMHAINAALASACLLLLASCQGKDAGSEPAHAAETIEIVTTTGMVADLVREIGGSHVTVHNLIGEGIDPHLYKPNRDDVAALIAADMVFYNGLMLEGKMGQALEKVAGQKPVVAVAEGLPEDQLIHPDDAEGHPDPHVWLDPDLWARCSDVVVETLGNAMPMHVVEFRKNQSAFEERARALGAYGRASIGTIPRESRLLVTSHDAFNYFGRAFDIEVLGVQGITTESEAGLADIERLVDVIVARGVPAVFIESSVPPRSVEALVEGARARGVEVRIGGELFTDAMGPPGSYEGTWPGMVDHDITTVTNALGGTPEGAPPQ